MGIILETERYEIGNPPVITKEEEENRWSNIKCSTRGIKHLPSEEKTLTNEKTLSLTN